MDTIKTLEELKLKNRFSKEDWKLRGLIPSPKEIIREMKDEVNKFISFLIELIRQQEEITEETIQNYFDEWDSYHLDTEETEYVADEMSEIMTMLGLEHEGVVIW